MTTASKFNRAGLVSVNIKLGTKIIARDKIFEFKLVTEKGYQFVTEDGERFDKSLLYINKGAIQNPMYVRKPDVIPVIMPSKRAEIIDKCATRYVSYQTANSNAK